MSEKLLRDFYLGFIRIHILYHASRQEVYGLDLMQELGRHGYHVGAGTLYPILHALEEKGYLLSRKQIVSGKVRRYYHATQRGKWVLKQATQQAVELLHELTQENR